MKKLTKRLTMIVAILLSLVLLSSSIVSTTLAKYVVTKSATTEVGLQKFGITVSLSSTDLSGEKTVEKKGNTVSLSYDKVILKPGDLTYRDAIKASITAEKAAVAANVTIKVDIECDDTKYTITSSDFSSGFATPKVYNPIEFYVASEGCGTGDKQLTVSGTTALEIASENAILGDIKTAASNKGITFNNYTSGNTLTGTIAEDAAVSANNINVGFVWKDSTGANANEISTLISEREPTFKITYTITVDQKS